LIKLSIILSQSSLGWVGGREGDTTLTWSDIDVAIDTPAWAPGVLDEDVFLAVLSSVSDSEDTVIELSTAGRASENT